MFVFVLKRENFLHSRRNYYFSFKYLRCKHKKGKKVFLEEQEKKYIKYKSTIKPLNKYLCFNNFLFIFLLTVSAFEPDFVFPLENVTVAQGRDATFTCVVNNLGGYRVSGEATPARVCNQFFNV